LWNSGILSGSNVGAPIYLSPDGKTRTTIVTDPLINPTGLELGSDGSIYIFNKGFTTGQGEVLRLKQNNPSSPDSVYDQVKRYTTTNAADGDPADIYYPVLPNATPARPPSALGLQAALLNKADYSNYAEKVASYGFCGGCQQ
jgi:hypothetical protein